jgi:hypothetical protein
MKTTSENFSPSDSVIRHFLLGRLDAVEQKGFEERLMTDDRLHERLRQAELQLADDFVGERLDGFDRQRFLKTFNVTVERNRLVTASDALQQRFGPARDARRALLPQISWRSSFYQPALRFALGVLVLLLLIGSFWLVTKEPTIVRRFLPRRAPSPPAANIPPQESHHPANEAPPVHRESSSSPSEHESSPPTETRIVTTIVPSGDSRKAPVIGLPAGVEGFVRFELAVEGIEATEFHVEVVTADQTIFAVGPTAPIASGLPLDVDVPVKSLKTGDYEIRLSLIHDGSKQAVANYYFRIQ